MRRKTSELTDDVQPLITNPWLRICFGRCTSGISWTHSPQLAFKCGFLFVVMDALVNDEPWGTVSWPLMPWCRDSLTMPCTDTKCHYDSPHYCEKNSETGEIYAGGSSIRKKTHKTWRCHMQLNLTTHVGTFRFIYWNILHISASIFYSESILQSQQWTMTLLFMEEILHQLVVSQYLPSFTSFSSQWWRISSINRITLIHHPIIPWWRKKKRGPCREVSAFVPYRNGNVTRVHGRTSVEVLNFETLDLWMFGLPSLTLTAKAPENGWLEDYSPGN